MSGSNWKIKDQYAADPEVQKWTKKLVGKKTLTDVGKILRVI